MIEVLYQRKEGEVAAEASFFAHVHEDGSAALHFRQGNRPFIAILNADEVRQLSDSINKVKVG